MLSGSTNFSLRKGGLQSRRLAISTRRDVEPAESEEREMGQTLMPMGIVRFALSVGATKPTLPV